MIYLKIFSFLFGLCIGSFLNAAIYRLPRKISLSHPRSRSKCPHCAHVIRWYENIPLFSFLFLRGKCSECKNIISLQYPLIEFIVGVFALLITPRALGEDALLNYVFSLSVFATFVVIFMIDIRHKIIPNEVNIYLALTLFVSVLLVRPYTHWLVGGAVGLLFPLGVTYLFYILRGQIGLGGGDIKLYGALGLYLGPLGIMQNIFMSCFVGAIIGASLILTKVVDRKTPIPFGPSIIVVAFTQIFFSEFFNKVLSYISV